MCKAAKNNLTLEAMVLKFRIAYLNKALLVIFIGFFCCPSIWTQSCELPFLNAVSETSTEGFTISWNDSNSEIAYWEIEFGVRGFERDGLAEISNVTQNSHTFNQLLSGYSYEIYLQSVCQNGEKSGWNGPWFANTFVDNSSPCGLFIELPDSNCPERLQIPIEVKEAFNQKIGIDKRLARIELIIEHEWPADIGLEIISPAGKSAVLSHFNGNGKNDYGNSESPDCSAAAVFTLDACTSIQNAAPPFSGSFIPEDDFENIFYGEDTNGLWNLSVCDNAAGDIGTLKYVRLVFEELSCLRPKEFRVTDVEATSIELQWTSNMSCRDVRIEYRRRMDPPNNTFIDFVECGREIYTLTNLDPDTEYLVLAYSECDNDLESIPVCDINITTNCDDSMLSEDFNSLGTCTDTCKDSCYVGELWSNVNEAQDQINWLVREGKNTSAHTGPGDDASGKGRYIQTESAKACSGDNFIASIVSRCLEFKAETSCDLIFDYHVYGTDNAIITVEYKINEADWIVLEEILPVNVNQWQQAVFDLPNISDPLQLRISAIESENLGYSDIALDNIKIIGADTIPLREYYADNDFDGFGDPSRPSFLCTNRLIDGFSANDRDCDDNNAMIYPGAPERFCNGIDENCNGMQDDNPIQNIAYQLEAVTDASCPGKSDGLIDISNPNGTGSFSFAWSNGSTDEDLESVPAGVYSCTISDISGCTQIIEDIEVGVHSNIEYEFNVLKTPSCMGIAQGSISIELEASNTDYVVEWSNGVIADTLNGVSSGIYHATISDSEGCSLVTDAFELHAPQILSTGIVTKSDASCNAGLDGFVRAAALGGSPPYLFNWSNGRQGSLITGLSPGNYSVTIQDQNNCTDIIENIVIGEPEPLQLELINIENQVCPGQNEGLADISVSGGTQPYSYRWSNGRFVEDLINVPAGNYSITVTDFNACSEVLTNILIEDPAPISVQLDSIARPRCPGSDNGFLSVDIDGGSLPYKLNWNLNDGNFSEKNFITDLNNGRYSLTVTDRFNCKSEPINYNLTNVDEALNLSVIQLDSVLCHNEASGSLIAVNNNGVPPLDFNWSAGKQSVKPISSDTIFNLLPGKYNLTITDSEGCSGISDSINIENAEEIIWEPEINNNKCFGNNEGSIQLQTDGGSPPYLITWNNGEIGEEINELENGNYSFTITDDLNCSVISNDIIISSPDSLTIDVEIMASDQSNNGQIEIDVLGGTPGYRIEWPSSTIGTFNGALASDLAPGNYLVTVLDANDCQLDSLINVPLVSQTQEIQTIKNSLNIYPNPNTGLLNLDYPQTLNLSNIEIRNIDGIHILSINGDQNIRSIDLTDSQLKSGVYILSMNFDGVIISRKIVLLK